jgi:hypothetical protein
MKPYNKQEFNRLCAKFLGWKHYEGLNPSWNGSFETIQSDSYFFNRVYTKSELRFHSDWNWIMEVALKIRSIQPFETEYNDEKSIVPFVNFRSAVVVALMHANKKVAVETIWEFLNWYNEQTL